MQLRGTEIERKIRYHVEDPRAANVRLAVADWDALLDFDFPVTFLQLCRIPPLERAMDSEERRADGKARGMQRVRQFVELMIRDGWPDMPPLLLVGDWMFDGKHRVTAHRALGHDSIAAIDLAPLVSMKKPFHWRIKPPGESYFADLGGKY